MGFIRVLLLVVLGTTLTQAACPDQNLLDNPDDPRDTGPWPVGTKEFGELVHGQRKIHKLAVWYPAIPGSQGGHQKLVYDVREQTPKNMGDKVPFPVALPCECYADLPLDIHHGPYPVMIMVHGTGAWRAASLTNQVHWASRGFVVIAADYPGITLKDMLNVFNLVIPPLINQPGDTKAIIEWLAAGKDPRLDFLRGHIDVNHRLAIGGHSAGASALTSLAEHADVIIPMAGGGAALHPKIGGAILAMAAQNDTIVNPGSSENVFKNSPTPKGGKYLADVESVGHLFCTDLCAIEADKGGIVGVAREYQICNPLCLSLFGDLGTDGCHFKDPNFLQPEAGMRFVNYAVTAVLEKILMCDEKMQPWLTNFPDRANNVWKYRQEL